MKRLYYLNLLTSLFSFKTITDEVGNEYVLFKSEFTKNFKNITDRTEFEAFQNHIHIIENIKKDEFDALIPVCESLGKTLLCILKRNYPDKHFFVFVSLTLHDSMIIRFHQKWEGEEPFCNPQDFTSPYEKVFLFEA